MDARKCLNGGWFGPSQWSLTITQNFTKHHHLHWDPTIGSALSSDNPIQGQSQMEGCATSWLYGQYEVSPWSTIFEKMSIKIQRQFKVNLFSFLYNSNPYQSFVSAPRIHQALTPIQWQFAHLTTISQSKANWTPSWGWSEDISAVSAN
jgi:hypothetical protein